MSQQPAGNFSLFPSPNTSKPPPVLRNTTPRPRRSESRERRATTPQQERATMAPQSRTSTEATPYASPPRNQGGRTTPQPRVQTPVQYQSHEFVSESPARARIADGQTQSPERQPQAHPVQEGRQQADVPVRTETAFSEANTLVHSTSRRSRSSIAKLPLPDDSSSADPTRPIRSMFPTYNPEVPLNRQDYAPTQLSPARIPRGVISRQTYQTHADSQFDAATTRPDHGRQPSDTQPGNRVASPEQNPFSADSAYRWAKRPSEPPAVPKPCSTEQLKSLWKIANGWKASGSEGRVYCMKLTQEKDAPVYNLSSSSQQPFYDIRLDPTSASAYVTVARFDPSKTYKLPKRKSSPTNNNGGEISRRNSDASGSAAVSSTRPEGKNWNEALTFALEEESRKHRPNDGLVALLMPSPAARMAIAKADDPSALAAAERECARLVWDDDSSCHFLVHPALATPFCVTVERSPAWSRVEYTLEHHESPQHLAKLTRDGTGGGWLELDTSIASKIEAYYIVDVAVTALMLVAAADEKNLPSNMADSFEPPPGLSHPSIPGAAVLRGSANAPNTGEEHGFGNVPTTGKAGKMKKKKSFGKHGIEVFELDVESQQSLEKGKRKAKEFEDGLPWPIRVLVKLVKGVFKVFIWVLTIVFKCLGFFVKGLYRCCGSKY